MTDERYSRQVLFEGIGEAGQAMLARSSAVIIGCGALGGVQADILARAGVGKLRLSIVTSSSTPIFNAKLYSKSRMRWTGCPRPLRPRDVSRE